MPPKSRSKASSPWHRCESCRVVLSHKDVALHQQGSCPPPDQDWSHGFIRRKVIYSWLGAIKPDALKNLPSEEVNGSVWISSSVLKMCGMCVGEPVLIEASGMLTVKVAWPLSEKSLSNVLMSKEDLELIPDIHNAPVTVRRLPHPLPPAHEILVVLQNEKTSACSHMADILLILRSQYCGTYIQAGSILHVPHYGKMLKFQVDSISPLPVETIESVESGGSFVDAVTESFQQLSFGESNANMKGFCSTPVQLKPETTSRAVLDKSLNNYVSDLTEQIATPVRKTVRKMTEDSYVESSLDKTKDELSLSYPTLADSHIECVASEVNFFHVTFSSEWRLKNDTEDEEKFPLPSKNTLSSIGGLKVAIEELQGLMKLALLSHPFNHSLKVAKGVLLFGPPGTGKTMLAHALASESNAATHIMQGAEHFSKLLGETETRLREFFSNATSCGPSVIILDEIDSLCPKKSTSNGSTELERRVISTLSALLDGLHMKRVFVIATTSRLDFVDPVIRRPGRLDHEVEIPVPSPDCRIDILTKMLLSVPHSLSESEIKSIALAAHGFVGADLASLVSQAGMQAFDSSGESSPVTVKVEHMKWALMRIHPSAMREVLVEIPNVRWSDIGGQENLKLNLQQSVEWPLTHPEAFSRLGIKPPKGVLMFGPPGCSKTMIAKALATESKLNFLSIKGPELFSKWVGESERAVRELFRKARLVAPAIIFFDEIDALGGERASTGSTGGSNVQERVLAQLLTEMDGVTTLENVTIVAATNRPDRIDKALLRPGRLDRIVYVPLPDKETRKQIFDLQLCKMPVCEDLDLDVLVHETDGYSGAEVLAVCYEAALKALEEDISACVILKEHFSKALKVVTPRTPPSLLKLYQEYLNS